MTDTPLIYQMQHIAHEFDHAHPLEVGGEYSGLYVQAMAPLGTQVSHRDGECFEYGGFQDGEHKWMPLNHFPRDDFDVCDTYTVDYLPSSRLADSVIASQYPYYMIALHDMLKALGWRRVDEEGGVAVFAPTAVSIPEVRSIGDVRIRVPLINEVTPYEFEPLSRFALDDVDATIPFVADRLLAAFLPRERMSAWFRGEEGWNE